MRLRKREDRPVDASGTATCDACGDVVGVLPSGRCELGHRVTSPERAAAALASADTGPGPEEAARSSADDSFAGASASPSFHLGPDTGPAPPLARLDGIDSGIDERLGTTAPDAGARPMPPVPVLDPEPATSEAVIEDGRPGKAYLLRPADAATEQALDASYGSALSDDTAGRAAGGDDAQARHDVLRSLDDTTAPAGPTLSAGVDAAGRWGEPAAEPESIEPGEAEPGARSGPGPWAEDDGFYQDLLELDGAQPRSR